MCKVPFIGSLLTVSIIYLSIAFSIELLYFIKIPSLEFCLPKSLTFTTVNNIQVCSVLSSGDVRSIKTGLCSEEFTT